MRKSAVRCYVICTPQLQRSVGSAVRWQVPQPLSAIRVQFEPQHVVVTTMVRITDHTDEWSVLDVRTASSSLPHSLRYCNSEI